LGWEELPYWLKGYGDLGYVLKDEKIIAQAKKWINAVIATQRPDGWFGPRELLTTHMMAGPTGGLQTTDLEGKPDLWPHMIMLNALQSYYEVTGDVRVIGLMSSYFKWENTLPVSAFGEGYWPKMRFGDNIDSVFWLYNRTGEPWLLYLARKIHAGMARWDEDVVSWHNVNIAQGFRAGTIFSMLSKEDRHVASAERNYQKVVGTYGQFPGGGFVGDENARPGYTDPRGGIETCGIVEFMHSFEMLTRITARPIWADRCEEIAFNGLPAAMTPEAKALHYINCANQVQLDRGDKSPGIQIPGTTFSYSPYLYRCCQHNVAHGWPYYAEELWLATPDNGLCASLYCASAVTARIGDGTTVTISEETDYPFSETVAFRVALPKSCTFPLYLRIPRWCEEAVITINGRMADASPRPLTYVRIERNWGNGDVVTLRLPQKIAVRRWAKNQDAASVQLGPLGFSLMIKERLQKHGESIPNWPEWEVFPESPWNYGLVLDAQNPASSFQIIKGDGPLPAQPFVPDAVPIKLKAKGRRIPNWQTDRNHLVSRLQPSPVRSDEPIEDLTLIPMGAARLRVTMFPVLGDGPDARDWVAPSKPKPSLYKASASHCFAGDTVEALDDGLEPADSNDHEVPRFTWWDHCGTTEWVQYDFPQPMEVSSVAVYWFDEKEGGCKLPASWRLLYRDGEQWKEIPGPAAPPPTRDQWNSMTFARVKTTALRIEAQLRPGLCAGILQWNVK
jgi:hypothetical protein